MIYNEKKDTVEIYVEFRDHLITQLEFSIRISKIFSPYFKVNLDRIGMILKALDEINAYAEAEKMRQISEKMVPAFGHNQQGFEIIWDKRAEDLTQMAYCVIDQLFKNVEGK